ncbi:hypothetical protein [Desulfoluna sp.]|uniref:hypothetical protein n=1 Tax=Desulfoluna sp. TaxID=2045199 RepID=UPI00262367BE|nr:hypothetical protein [Desulfoluna sp.]
MTYEQREYVNGYLPPAVGGNTHLRRDRLIGILVRAKIAGHRLFLIEGQAGQGKSTLAAQYIGQESSRALWYAMETGDTDPARLLHCLLGRLKESLPIFSSPFLEAMVVKGEIVSVDCHAYGVRLAESLASQPPFILVFDDLHLLDTGSPSAAFLKGFIETRVPQRTLFLLSRYSVSDLLFGGRQPLSSTRITGKSLAMNRGEIADCLTHLFHLSPTREMVNHVHAATEGWVMGVLARAHTLQASGETAPLPKRPEAEVKAYLDQELVESFPREMLPLLTDLSWADTVPMDLARTLSGRDDILGLFLHLVSHNFFTRFATEKKTEAVFHHHLQHCLREQSKKYRSEEELKKLFVTLAGWYETHGKPEDAARFFFDAKNYDEVERIIRDRGLALCSAGRLETLRQSIGRMPEEVITQRGWLACNYGISLMEVEPPRAFAFLKAAEACFLQKKDALGLLIAQVQQIYYHSWVDDLFDAGRPLLEPVHRALRKLENELEEQVRLKTLYCLACGYAFFECNLTKALLCADQALELALKKGYINAVCEIRTIRIYIHGFKGNWNRFNHEIEPLVPLISSPRVSSYNRFLGWMTLLKTLLIEGDTETYHHYRELTPDIIQNDTIFKEVVTPFFAIWDIDAALSGGKAGLAERIAIKALPRFHAMGNAHMLNQMLHYQAFALAMQNEHRKVPAICREAINQRSKSGSPFFIALTNLITGAALTHSGEFEKAEPLLLDALGTFESMEETYERTGTLAHLSHLYAATGRQDLADTHTARWLHLIKHNHCSHHFSWPLSMITSLVDRAVAEGIEVETATSLAKTKLQRGYTPNGHPIPLLCIKTFGGFTLALDDRIVLTLQDLTTSQQQLLALLLSRSGTLSVDEIQTLFWPDASPQKGRASLDTMVSRLKKTLKKAIAPHNPSDFLSVKKEKLILSNVNVDAWQFSDLAEEGLQLFRTQSFWQATNRFRTAFALVRGSYLTGFSDDGTSHEYREYVLRPLIQRAALTWFNSLTQLKVPMAKDLATLETQITGDPESLELVKAIHRHHTTANASHRATSLLKKYRDKLTREGLPDDEIETLLEGLWG